MPVYNSAGYNTSTYAYPQYEHNTPYYNEFQDIEIRACCPPSLLPSLRPASRCSLASRLNFVPSICCRLYESLCQTCTLRLPATQSL